MKIRRITWKDDPVLGDLELDLVNHNTGVPYKTIVFAGENGTGKTTILESLATFLNMGSFEYFENITYDIAGSTYQVVKPQSGNVENRNFFDRMDSSGNITPIRSTKNINRNTIDNDSLDIRHYGCVLSKARADYKTDQIKGTTTQSLDKGKYNDDKADDFTSLKQLIVDIENQDNAEYANINKANGTLPKSWSEFYPSSKIYRFKNAFDNFFGNLQYDSVVDRDSEKMIQFKKNGKSIPIDRLSTGEKQIVFRGTYLLRDNKMLVESTIMIDEPELSMHPKWQKGILKYYKSLFTNTSGQQTVQLFAATHSEYVLEEALRDRDETLVIILTQSAGQIVASRIDAPSVLPTITSAETNYLAFDVVSIDYHIELYGFLQQKENLPSVKGCDVFIKDHVLFDSSMHHKASNFKTTTYETLPTYIRNAIDHPDSGNTYTDEELRISTELLIQLCT